jgi:hypothetical protein
MAFEVLNNDDSISCYDVRLRAANHIGRLIHGRVNVRSLNALFAALRCGPVAKCRDMLGAMAAASAARTFKAQVKRNRIASNLSTRTSAPSRCLGFCHCRHLVTGCSDSVAGLCRRCKRLMTLARGVGAATH